MDTLQSILKGLSEGAKSVADTILSIKQAFSSQKNITQPVLVPAQQTQQAIQQANTQSQIDNIFQKLKELLSPKVTVTPQVDIKTIAIIAIVIFIIFIIVRKL